MASLRKFRKILDQTFAVNLAKPAKVEPSNVRGTDTVFGPATLLDDDRETYWTTDDHVTSPTVSFVLPKPVTFNVVSLREYLPLGQRVRHWALDQWQDGAWAEFAKGESIGNRRLWRRRPDHHNSRPPAHRWTCLSGAE